MTPFSKLLTGTVLGLALSTGAAHALYTEYDSNNNGYLDRNEYVNYSYNTIDYDNDGLLDDSEWNDYTSVWYDPFDVDYDGTAFNSYDTDKDGYIGEDEYASAYDVDLYDEWDADNNGYVDNEEWDEVATAYDDADERGVFDW